MRATVCESASDSPFKDATDASTKCRRRVSPFPIRTGQLSMDLQLSAGGSANRKLPLVCKQTCLKTDLTPSALFHQANLKLPPLDPQSWILLSPIVSHVSECSTIRKAFGLSRRDDNGAETSTRVAKKEKACSRRNLGIVLPYHSTI